MLFPLLLWPLLLPTRNHSAAASPWTNARWSPPAQDPAWSPPRPPWKTAAPAPAAAEATTIKEPHAIAFRPIGYTVATLGYAHIHMHLDLKGPIDQTRAVLAALGSGYNVTASQEDAYKATQVFKVQAALQRLLAIREMTTTLPPTRSSRHAPLPPLSSLQAVVRPRIRRTSLPEQQTVWSALINPKSQSTPGFVCAAIRDNIRSRGDIFSQLPPSALHHPDSRGRIWRMENGVKNVLNSYSFNQVHELISDLQAKMENMEDNFSAQAALNARPSLDEQALLQGCPPELSVSSPDLYSHIINRPSLRMEQLHGRQTRQAESASAEMSEFLRWKKAIPLLAIGVGVAAATGATGTFLGLYNSVQLGLLQGEVQQQSRVLKALVHHVDDLDLLVAQHGASINALHSWVTSEASFTSQALVALNKNQLIGAVVDAIAAMSNDYAAIASSLMHHRLALNAVSEPSLREALRNVSASAADLGFGLLVSSVSDALQCEASFASTRDGLDIFLHVPLAGVNDHLALYEHLELPVQMANEVFVTFRPHHNLLAVSADEQRFKPMTSAQLSQCSKLGGAYLCPNENVVRKAQSVKVNDPDACLFALFQHNFDRINGSCPIHLLGPTDVASALSATDFLLASTSPHVGTVSCPDGSSTSFSADHVTRLQVAPGCQADTDAWTVSASLDITTQVQPVVFGWSGNLAQLLAHIDLDEFARLRARLPFEPVPTESRHAAQWVAAKQEAESLGVFAGSASGPGIVTMAFAACGAFTTLVLVVAAVGYGLFRCGCRSCCCRAEVQPLQLPPHLPDAVAFTPGQEKVRFLAIA